MNRNHLKSLSSQLGGAKRRRRADGTRSAFATVSFIIAASLLAVLLAACPSTTTADAAPGAPTIGGTADVTGGERAKVTWTAPTDKGIINGDGTVGTITGYTVYYHTATFGDNDKPTTKVDVADGAAVDTVVWGLTPATKYYFKVSAKNTTGEGILSGEVTATPDADTTAPVFTLSAITPATGVTSLTLTADEPIKLLGDDAAANGAKLTVTNDVGGTDSGVTVNGAELGDDEMTVTITIASTDFVGAQDVSVKIAADFAENKAATAIKNDPAAPATTTTVVPPDAAPGVPTSVAAAPGIGEVTVSWGEPASKGYFEGSEGTITAYTVYWATATGVSKSSTDKYEAAATATSYVVPNLDNDQNYYFIVTATTGAGEGDAPTEVTATPRANAAPGAPTNTATANPDANGKKVTVSWDAPTDLGYYNGIEGVITGYTVYWATTTGVTKSSSNNKDVSATDDSLVIDGLTDNQTYYFVVTATSDAGESDESTEVNAIIPADTTAPTLTLGTISAGTAVTTLTLIASEPLTSIGAVDLLTVTNDVDQATGTQDSIRPTVATLGADEITVTLTIPATEFISGETVNVIMGVRFAFDKAAPTPNFSASATTPKVTVQ